MLSKSAGKWYVIFSSLLLLFFTIFLSTLGKQKQEEKETKYIHAGHLKRFLHCCVLGLSSQSLKPFQNKNHPIDHPTQFAYVVWLAEEEKGLRWRLGGDERRSYFLGCRFGPTFRSRFCIIKGTGQWEEDSFTNSTWLSSPPPTSCG
jgi:hypothetical protein